MSHKRQKIIFLKCWRCCSTVEYCTIDRYVSNIILLSYLSMRKNYHCLCANFPPNTFYSRPVVMAAAKDIINHKMAVGHERWFYTKPETCYYKKKYKINLEIIKVTMIAYTRERRTKQKWYFYKTALSTVYVTVL